MLRPKVRFMQAVSQGADIFCLPRGYSLNLKSAKGKRLMAEWKHFVRQTIRQTPPRVLRAIYDSVPERMAALIDAQGGAIRY